MLLGQLRAEIDHGLKTKVEAHMEFYVFHEGAKVVRAMD
jgi:hypothetical protein